MASLKNLEAALLQLKGKATEHYGAIEILINNPTGISDHTDYVTEIIKHAKGLAECEEAYGALQAHFVPQPQTTPSPASLTEPRPTQEGSLVVTDDNSPTMKRTQKASKARKTREKKND